ncbi:choice-of-anchor K domain-containing protein [Floridanema aerugineum]|uniref:Choice-of-anchor K domain-containing protein n=1 Tax=Floridaenema aerugineum BLCC-F46 TaxID=3153654 RepID=A0ABV4X0T6_9CYAN
MALTFTGESFGIFGPPVNPLRTTVFEITDEDGGTENRLTWGRPATGSFSNFVQFDGEEFNTGLNEPFYLGDLTYGNGQVSQNTNFQGDFPLEIYLSFSDPVDREENFEFTFNILETTNTTGDPVLDGDFLRFSDAGLSQETFRYKGNLYTLELFGFETDDGDLTTKGQFISPEDTVTTTSLFGKVSQVSSTVVTTVETVLTYRKTVTSAIIGISNNDIYQLEYSAGEEIVITEEVSTTYTGGVWASKNDDSLTGSIISDIVYANQGADTLYAGEGGDLIYAGDDNDRIYGDEDEDIINGNQGDDNVSGDKGDDLLRGGKGNDTVSGGDDDDVLIGDLGTDTLTGGSGADTYIFRRDEAVGQYNVTLVDCITDFDVEEGDRIGFTEDITPELLTYDSLDINQDGISDTVIKLGSTNEILGVVMSVSITTIEASLFTITTTDPILTL